jgi:diguanylate cyclase
MGHEVGDLVLQNVAFRLTDALPEGAALGRWGGDEFVIILPPSQDMRYEISILSQKLIDVVNAPFEMKGEKLSLGLSIGIAYYPTDAQSHQDVIQAADLAVAEVKRTLRGQVLTYSDTYAETQRRRFDLSRALGEAIASEEITIAYQPLIDAQTGHVAALEALARWDHPQLGVISPDEFVRLAEDTDRIIALGDWMLKRACFEAVRWTGPDHAPKVAVNVSVKQLMSENYALKVLQTLSQTGLAPSRLELEVTESLFTDDNADLMLQTVASLRQLGIDVHIDDFGTGYSSLSRLHRFPVSAIKIDKSFVAQLDDQGSVIIESAVLIARRMGFKVIAEGVETLDQVTALTRMGVDYFQGYYFGRPDLKAKLTSFEPIWLGEAKRKRA